jgi:hypothetical protein
MQKLSWSPLTLSLKNRRYSIVHFQSRRQRTIVFDSTWTARIPTTQPTNRKIEPVERSKKLLVKALREAEVTFEQQQSYTKNELQDFARIRGIDLFEEKDVILKRWQGQPKGLLQVLWERGFIDEQL